MLLLQALTCTRELLLVHTWVLLRYPNMHSQMKTACGRKHSVVIRTCFCRHWHIFVIGHLFLLVLWPCACRCDWFVLWPCNPATLRLFLFCDPVLADAIGLYCDFATLRPCDCFCFVTLCLQMQLVCGPVIDRQALNIRAWIQRFRCSTPFAWCASILHASASV